MFLCTSKGISNTSWFEAHVWMHPRVLKAHTHVRTNAALMPLSKQRRVVQLSVAEALGSSDLVFAGVLREVGTFLA